MANSMFSRRHYEAIAEVIRNVGNQTSENPLTVWERFVDDLADLFHADNERFDRAKFEEACER